jgi:hypothetical protein
MPPAAASAAPHQTGPDQQVELVAATKLLSRPKLSYATLGRVSRPKNLQHRSLQRRNKAVVANAADLKNKNKTFS